MNKKIHSFNFKDLITIDCFSSEAKNKGRDEFSIVIRQTKPATERWECVNGSMKSGQGDIVYRSPRNQKKEKGGQES